MENINNEIVENWYSANIRDENHSSVLYSQDYNLRVTQLNSNP